MSPGTDLALRYNPWGFDESAYRVLWNVMATTRAQHTCALCFEGIPAGTRVRAQAEVCDGKAKTFRFCPACCDAMRAHANGADPDGGEIELRTQIGMTNSRRRSVTAAGAAGDIAR